MLSQTKKKIMECYKCQQQMREIVDFTLEPLYYCMECDILKKDTVTTVE